MKCVVLKLMSLMIAMACSMKPAASFSVPPPLAINHQMLPSVNVATALSMSLQSRPSKRHSSVECYMASSSEEESNSVKSPFDRPALAALDFFSIVLFAFVGTSSHNSASDYLAVMAVAVPFLLSWFATTPFLGLYSQDATSDKVSAFKATAKGWIVAIPLGCVLRGLIKGYVPPLPFVIVTMIATLVVIGGSRVAYTAVSEKKE